MASPKDWLRAFRLRTLPLSLSGIITGSAFALYNGHWNAAVFALALSTTLLFQVLSNLANDLGDTLNGADNADRVGPERTVQSGAITIPAMKRAVVITSLLSFVSAGFLIRIGTENLSTSYSWFYAGLAIACVIAAITYTIGKRAYGYHGLGDIFVFIFFGCVGVLGVYPLFAKSLDLQLIPGAVTMGMLSTAVLNMNNMRDQVNDASVGKRTVAVYLGLERSKVYHAFLVVSAIVSWMIFLGLTRQWFGFISCIPFILLVKHLMFVMRNKEPRNFDPELKKIALSTFFLAILYMITVILWLWLN